MCVLGAGKKATGLAVENGCVAARVLYDVEDLVTWGQGLRKSHSVERQRWESGRGRP